MRPLRIYVCHSRADNEFCAPLVATLRGAGADVWFDTHVVDSMRPAQALTEITEREVFVIVLSKAALSSTWVQSEYKWARYLYDMSLQSFEHTIARIRTMLGEQSASLAHESNSHRQILSIAVEPLDIDDFGGEWSTLLDFRQIDAGTRDDTNRSTPIDHIVRTIASFVPPEALRRELPQLSFLWQRQLPPELVPRLSIDEILEHGTAPLQIDSPVDELIARGQDMYAEADDQNVESPPAVWCVVANVAKEQPFGPGGKEMRRGTKHFAQGAKVYCLPALWGDGYEQIKVVGHHRGSHRYVTLIMPSKRLTNWRADLVYSPHVIAELAGHWDGTAASKLEAEELAAEMRQRESTRPPQNTSE